MNINDKNKLSQTGWLFTASIGLILVASTLIKDGMFMDAMLYTSVSHNLSKGLGTFWFPFFDAFNVANLSSFHEQPPLVFGIQSLFFKILGDSMYVERFYTFFTFCFTIFLIKLLWDEITKELNAFKSLSWLAVLLWITIPVCFWSYSNNMHENTMGIFTLGSVILSYKALQSAEHKFLLYILAAICICLAVLSKGFPGFFPISIPFLHWIFIRKKSFAKIITVTFIMLTVISFIGLMLYLYPVSRESLSIYLFKRALQRIHEVPSVDSRFFIFWRLLSELIPNLIFIALIYLISFKLKIDSGFKSVKNQAFLFLSIGISGSLPLMLTMVQNGFYFVPSLPFFGIGFALLAAPVLHKLLQRVNDRYHHILWKGSLFLLTAVIIFVFLQKDKFSRDKDLIMDVRAISSVVPHNKRINCDNQSYQDWSLNCYLVRSFGISINNVLYDSTEREFFLTGLHSPNPDTSSFDQIILNTSIYALYQKRTNQEK